MTDWTFVASRNMSFFQDCINAAGHHQHSPDYGLPPKQLRFVVRDGRQTFAFINPENNKEYLDGVRELALQGDLDELKQRYHEYGEALDRASDALKTNPCRETFETYVDAAKRLAAGLFLTNDLGRIVPEMLRDRLDDGIGVLTYPEERTPLMQSHLELLRIGAALQDASLGPEELSEHDDAKRRFEAYLDEYAYTPVNFNGEPWARDDVLDQLCELMHDDCHEQLEKARRSHEAKLEEREDLLDGVGDETVRRLARAGQLGTYLNEYRKFIFCKASTAYRPLFREIAEQYDLQSWRTGWKLTPREIIGLRFENDDTILSVLEKRDWAGVQYSEDEGYRPFDPGDALLERVKQELGEESEETAETELHGQVGNSGTARGEAKVVLSPDDFDKFYDGDVLVTTMTSVDFVPVMKRASAFVTNEGGITSHAAIVARELDKPCVLGTDNATSVFQDGDQVLVDAEEGVVRKQ